MIISLVAGGALIYFVTLSITKPLKRLVVTSKEISEGDLTKQLKFILMMKLVNLQKGFNEMTNSLRTLIEELMIQLDMLRGIRRANCKCKTSE